MDISALYSLFLEHRQISTDTRTVQPGSVFFALKGDHFDGNQFAEEALRRGASYAIVSDPKLIHDRMILVEDTLLALQTLARHHRQQFTGPVIAITGSNGKTTTKELIIGVLAKKYKVHGTTGNLNNHIGVPLTMLATPSGTEIIVCEMGANHLGEIAALCNIALPTHGLITNIGKAHLEGFGSMDGVKKAKGELFEHLMQHQGMAFINADEPHLHSWKTILPYALTYGLDPASKPDVYLEYSVTAETSGFILKDHERNLIIRSSMFGHYNAINLLAAYTVGQYFKVHPEHIVESLSSYAGGTNRSEMKLYKGCTIVKDAYNANPSSMELAIRAFSDRFPKGWVVVGDMKELGASTEQAHQDMIALLSSFSFERIYIVGDDFQHAFHLNRIHDPRIIPVGDVEKLKEHWSWELCDGKAVLIKGSRSMKLELLLKD